jgi:molybdate transport system substrate-binding protein
MAKTMIKGISSMATRLLLVELLDGFHKRSDLGVTVESVGGLDAAKRVQAGEAFDFVVLASEAIDKLVASGHVQAGSKVNFARSGIAVAVPAGAPQPDISTEAALRDAVQAAQSVSYSTGPSGMALAKLFERWGMTQEIRSRLVQAPPGVPVGELVARGEVALGFQQLSELMHLDGIAVLGPLPAAVQVTTTFSAAVCTGSLQVGAVQALLAYISSAQATAALRSNGMSPA